MTTVRRLVLGCVATASLTFAAGALATTQLRFSGATATGASATTVIDVSRATDDAASAQIAIYVPNGYTVNLGQTPGTQIGTVAAGAQLLEITANSVTPLPGTLQVADRGNAALQASAMKCTGTAAHAAIWLVHLTVSGQPVDVPVYVDPTSGSEATFSSAKLLLCLPQPYAKALPSYAPFGMKIVDAKLTLSAGVLTNPITANPYVWRTVLEPWAVTGAAANPAGTTEAQAIAAIPATLRLAARVRTVRHRRHGRTVVANSVLLSGKLLENMRGVAGARIAFFGNGKTAGSAKTRAAGAFSKAAVLRRRTTFTAKATVPSRATSCVLPLSPITAPGGCVSATLSGYTLVSSAVVAAPRKR